MIPRGSQNDPKTFWKLFFQNTVLGEIVFQNTVLGKKPILTKHVFRRKSTCREVFCQSATTKMTVGTVRSFHGFSEKGTL